MPHAQDPASKSAKRRRRRLAAGGGGGDNAGDKEKGEKIDLGKREREDAVAKESKKSKKQHTPAPAPAAPAAAPTGDNSSSGGGSKNKKKKEKKHNDKQQPSDAHSSSSSSSSNPLLNEFQQIMAKYPDMRRAFDPKLPENKREKVLDVFGDECMEIVKKYAWAIPNDRALNIIKHFAPIVEMAAGRGYWSSLLRERGVDVIAFDVAKEKPKHPNWTKVEKGGPDTLSAHSHRTLLLCYPDDFRHSSESIALSCLENYTGDTVIHIGELFGHSMNADIPWGRTSADTFQTRLVGEYHCVLRLPLPSWPTAQDTLTVWRRNEIVDVDGAGMIFVPDNEYLDNTAAAPRFAHLLKGGGK